MFEKCRNFLELAASIHRNDLMKTLCIINSPLGQIKNTLVRVTQPYLNLLVKPRGFFSGFLKKSSLMPFKMHKTIFFLKKNH